MQKNVIMKINNWIVAFVITVVLLIYILLSIEYDWQLYRLANLFYYYDNEKFTYGPILIGLFQTIKISFFTVLLSIVFGFISALMRISDFLSFKFVSYIYVEIIRNTPLIVQILISYFILSNIFDFNSFYASVITLGLFEGSYVSEIIRGSILSIDKGQWDAGYATGMGKMKVFRYIIFPQALPIILPSVGNIIISTIKDSSLLSVISVYELTFQAQKAVSETFLTFEIWFSIALIYMATNITIYLATKNIERRGYKEVL